MLFSLCGISAFFFSVLIVSFSYSVSATMNEMEADKLMRIRQVQLFSVLAAFVFVPRSSFLCFGNFLSFACRRGITGYREHVLW